MQAIGYFSDLAPARAGDAAEPAPSLSEQNDRFLAFCEENGYRPAAAFLDAEPAGDRPGARQLLHYLERPEKGFLVVVIEAFGHLGPSGVEAARAFFQITTRGAGVVSLREGPLDDHQMVGIWAAQDRGAGIGERVREAMRRRAVQGKVLGRPPYGYRVGEDGRLDAVEHEAALVRHIFRLYCQEGLGIRRIAKRLNEEGYRTRRDGNWSMVTIRDLLRNRVYLGTYHRFGVKVPGNHAAIVTEAELHDVERRMEQRRRPAAPARPSRFLLSGLVYCGEGRSRMIGVTRRQQWTRADGQVGRNTYRYYQSEARTNQSVGAYHTQRADDLEAEVLRHLTGEAPGAVRGAVLTAGDADAVAAETALARARVVGRMRGIDRRLSQSLQRAAGGGLNREALRQVAHDLIGEYQQAEDELLALDRRSAAQASDSERRRHQQRQLDRVRQEWDRLGFDERQALLRDVIERVVVDEDTVRTVLRA